MSCPSYKASSSIAAAVAAAISGSSVAHAQTQESSGNSASSGEVVQDVIITGTFIRRSEGFTPASPVSS